MLCAPFLETTGAELEEGAVVVAGLGVTGVVASRVRDGERAGFEEAGLADLRAIVCGGAWRMRLRLLCIGGVRSGISGSAVEVWGG